MIKEPKAMQEIHNIRINHYEERKNLSLEERIRLTNERARNLAKEFEIENLFVVPQPQNYLMAVSE